MKSILSVLAILCLSCIPAAAGVANDPFPDVSLLKSSPDRSPFSLTLSGTFDDQINASDNLSLWGTRADAGAVLVDGLYAGIFYNASWSDTGASDPFHRLGLSVRKSLPELRLLGASPYLDLAGGLLRHGSDSDPFLFSGLGLSYPLDFVTAGLRADLGLGVYWHLAEPELDTLGARFGLAYDF